NSNLKSEAYSDTINLLDYAFENFETSSIPKGTTFKFDKQEYKTTKKLNYTHSLDDQIKKKVKVDGTLEIINQNDIVITSFPLERSKKEVHKTNTEREVVKKEKKDVETNSLLENHFIKVAIYSLVFVFIATVFYHKSRKLNL